MNNYCPKCNFILDINKNIEIKKENDIQKVLIFLLNNNINISTDVVLEDIKKTSNFKDLKPVLQELIIKNYNEYKNLNKFGFFNCLNCGYFKNISNGSILIDNSKVKVDKGKLYYKLQSDNNILPHTKDYICPNENCKAHKLDYLDREAVFYREQNSYKLHYLCCICNHDWTIN